MNNDVQTTDVNYGGVIDDPTLPTYDNPIENAADAEKDTRIELAVSRGLVFQENDSPVLLNNPEKTGTSKENFISTKQINLAILPGEDDMTAIDSYLYEAYNASNQFKLSYLDLLLYFQGEHYTPFPIKNGTKDAESNIIEDADANYIVNSAQMNEAFEENGFLTTKFKSKNYSSDVLFTLTETETQKYLLRFIINSEEYIIGYRLQYHPDGTSHYYTPSIVKVKYNEHTDFISKCNTSVLENSGSDYFGFFWQFDAQRHAFVPSAYTHQNLSDDDQVAIKGDLLGCNLYPFYFNRAVSIPKNASDYFYTIKCNKAADQYKYNYTSAAKQNDQELLQNTIDNEFYIVSHVKTDADNFKITVASQWTSITNASPVALEVEAFCYDTNGQLVNDGNICFLCTCDKDKTPKVEILTSDKTYDISKLTSPVVQDAIFTLTSHQFNRQKVATVKLTVTPLMIYGKLDYLAYNIEIDCSKIMSGECELTDWAYYISKNDDSTWLSLKYGYNLYLSDTMYVSHASISFFNTENYKENLPTSFTEDIADYVLDITTNAQSSGIFAQDIELSELKENKLYLCKILIQVKIGETISNKTFYRYMFTTTDLNKHFATTRDYDSVYLDFKDYGSVNINFGDLTLSPDISLPNNTELYSTESLATDTKQVTISTENIQETNDSIEVKVINKDSGWQFLKDSFKVESTKSFVDAQLNAGNSQYSISYSITSKSIPETESFKPDYICESLYSYLLRRDPDKLTKVWGLQTNKDTAEPKLTDVLCAYNRCHNRTKKSSISVIHCKGTLTEDGFTTSYATGSGDIADANVAIINYERHILNNLGVNTNTYDAIKPVFLYGPQNGGHRYSEIRYTKNIPSLTTTVSVFGLTKAHALIDAPIRFNEMENGQALGQIIIFNKNNPSQTNIYFSYNKNGELLLHISHYGFNLGKTYSIGDLLATKLSNYYIYHGDENITLTSFKTSINPSITDVCTYKNTYTVSGIPYGIKNTLKIKSGNAEKLPNIVEHNGDDYYLKLDEIVYFNGVRLYDLNQKMYTHPEVKHFSKNLQFTPVDKHENYQYCIKNPSTIETNFFKLNSTEGSKTVLQISPTGELKYLVINENKIESYIGTNTKKPIFIWDKSKESLYSPDLITKHTTYLIGHLRTSAVIQDINLTYLDYNEGETQYQMQVSPRFMNVNLIEGGVPDWNKFNISNAGVIMVGNYTLDDGMREYPIQNLANDTVHYL